MHRFSALNQTGKVVSWEESLQKASVINNQNRTAQKTKRQPERKKSVLLWNIHQYVQWIRQGSSVENAKYICLDDSTDYSLALMSPVSEKKDIEMVKGKACYLKFGLQEEGYYNAYLIVKKAHEDTLYVNIAKAELLSHSCRNGHHKKMEARPVMHYPEVY